MILVTVQVLLLLLAGAALLFLWRKVAVQDRVFGAVVALGLVGRAVAGQVLFWISYLDLIPPGGLHQGGGIWFFGLDGGRYMTTVLRTLETGQIAILSASGEDAAAIFVAFLALFGLLFGAVTSVAILLNVFCYVFTCCLIGRCAVVNPAARTPALFAIAAITFSPSAVLWSLQPLKETFTYLLIVAFIGTALLWQQTGRLRIWPWWIVAAVVAMWVILFAITGTRWYLGFALLGGTAMFLSLIITRARQRRLAIAGSSLVVFVLLSRAFLYGGGIYVPIPLKQVLSPRIALQKPVQSPVPRSEEREASKSRRVSPPAPAPVASVSALGQKMVAVADDARVGYVETGGPTEIRVKGKQSRATRFFGGFLAMVIPRFIITGLGFLQIGGGRGLFWFADLDTLLFDAVAIAAIVMVWRRGRQAFNPMFWLVTLTIAFVTVPIVYVVTNFGTMFRLREMILVLVSLLPLAATMGASPAGDGGSTAEIVD